MSECVCILVNSNSANKCFSFRYDFFSIMHYRALAFSKNGLPSLTPLSPNIKENILGQRDGFSEVDIKRINKAYPVTTLAISLYTHI